MKPVELDHGAKGVHLLLLAQGLAKHGHCKFLRHWQMITASVYFVIMGFVIRGLQSQFNILVLVVVRVDPEQDPIGPSRSSPIFVTYEF